MVSKIATDKISKFIGNKSANVPPKIIPSGTAAIANVFSNDDALPNKSFGIFL